MNLIDMVVRAKNDSPKKLFLKYEKRKYTFLQVFEEITKLAKGLRELGISKGDRVALLINNSPEFIFSYFAIVSLGAEVVPFNTFLRIEEIVYILNDCKAKILITTSDFKKVLTDFSKSRVQSLEHIISTEKIEGLDHLDFKEVMKTGDFIFAECHEDDVAVIIYTSGTTGHPKGAMLTHKNLISNAAAVDEIIKIKKNDKFIVFLPMFHAFSWTVCVMLPFYYKLSLTIIKSIQPFGKIIKALMTDRITIFVAIPQVYNVLSQKKIPGFFKLINPIRLCVSGAAPLAGEVLRKFEEKIKVPLLEGYGLSEASPVVSVNPLFGLRKPGSIGLALPGVKVRIIDEEGKEVDTNQTGEIVAKGPNIMKGYFNKEEETKEILKDGWLHTGDIGKIDEDGYIYIVDRKKDLILVNGMNLYPREVEELLYTHPAVEDASIVGKKDALHGEVPVGIVKLKEGIPTADLELALKQHLRPHLANFKIPNKFEFWDELPRTATGKILKREIKRIVNEKKQS